MRTAAILPVKTFARAKQRLGAAVDAPDRSVLAGAMGGEVLAALAAVPGLDDVVVVTAEERAAAAAREAGGQVAPDPVEAGQAAAAGPRIQGGDPRGARHRGGDRPRRHAGAPRPRRLPGARRRRGVRAAGARPRPALRGDRAG